MDVGPLQHFHWLTWQHRLQRNDYQTGANGLRNILKEPFMNKQLMTTTIALLLVAGCSDRNTPRNVAEDFIHSYYQRADQETALRMCEALASEKLMDEIQLVRTVRRRGELPSETPEVRFEMRTRRSNHENHVLFNYRLTIKNTNSSSSSRNVIIVTELIDAHWKIINFEEYSD